MKVFVINLKRSTDRRQHMKTHLERLGIDYEFFEAIDGEALTEEDIERCESGAFPPWPSFNARHLSRSEIGCLLSHLAIYRKIIDENMEWACILEDDAVPGKHAGELIKALPDHLACSRYELLLLGHFGCYGDSRLGAECVPAGDFTLGGYRLAKAVEQPFGTHAYIIRRSAADKLLRQAYPLRMPMDYLTGHSVAIGVRLRILTPPCITQGRHLFVSTINDRKRQGNFLFLRRSRRIKYRLGEKYPILRTVQRICLYPFVVISLKLRKVGLMDGDSYADNRYFQREGMEKRCGCFTACEADIPGKHE